MEGKTIKRNFILGEEWIFYKFYTGAKTADKILVDAIKPLTLQLISTGKIDQWFFIRYADPEPHVRVRLHCNDTSNLGTIIQAVLSHIEKYVEQELIWKVQVDAYQREVERYGVNTIELSEQLFFYESTLILNILPLLKNHEGEAQRWIFALKFVDYMLDCFRFTLKDKLHLLEELKEGFGREFGMNRFLKGQLDEKYRKQRGSIESSLDPLSENQNSISMFMPHLKDYKELITPISKRVIEFMSNTKQSLTIESLMGSYIHMAMNRIFRSNQRVHEMVLYDFLFRYYKSMVARKEAASDNSLTMNLKKEGEKIKKNLTVVDDKYI